MCGRYVFFSDAEQAEIQRILQRIEAKGKSLPPSGEIFPTHMAPALFYDVHLDADVFMWGFPQYNRSGVLINARSETVLEKPTFKDSFQHRRCVLPATGFYEWDKAKRKHLFTQPNQPLIYLAGIYRPQEGANRFVILTTAANASSSDVHDRMPVMIPPEQIEDWCRNEALALNLLHQPQPVLKHIVENAGGQQSLFNEL